MASSVDTIEYRGVTFRRYPDSERWADRMYFTPGSGDRQRGVGRLHQEIWKTEHGEIPPGHHVHHKDEDPLNNEPGNLVCLPGEDHRAEHVPPRGVVPPQLVAHHAEALVKAAKWHRSEAGRVWHREHGQRTWEGREPRQVACEWCGDWFSTKDRKLDTRFCSNKHRAYARKASGVDDEDRVCAGCGKTFSINRYAKASACSRRCGQRVRRRKS